MDYYLKTEGMEYAPLLFMKNLEFHELRILLTYREVERQFQEASLHVSYASTVDDRLFWQQRVLDCRELLMDMNYTLSLIRKLCEGDDRFS